MTRKMNIREIHNQRTYPQGTGLALETAIVTLPNFIFAFARRSLALCKNSIGIHRQVSDCIYICDAKVVCSVKASYGAFNC
ncbi:hypothetical protein BpHYR1_016190 [Brachionus plicatilis]|uniref:Uncharacterized protein n=1 Tax=Brachionus plicatilis TaxID=10195 RepID=A0A3M7R416_BRAPC|nr:hypothetical protein BpHYR1_016190 [Brachionus plicatilis]